MHKKNTQDSKYIARIKYKERKINTYIKWTTEKRGYLLWRDLVKLHDKYNIKVY